MVTTGKPIWFLHILGNRYTKYHNIKIAVDIPLLNLEIFLKEAAIFMQPAAYEKRKGNVQKRGR